MILVAITLETSKHLKQFLPFISIIQERYHPFLGQDLQELQPHTWVTTVKPFHAGIFPFLCLDAMVHSGKAHCRIRFSNEVLDFSMIQTVTHSDLGRLDNLQCSHPSAVHPNRACCVYQGFGQRIDLALNAIASLVFQSLHDLTKVETQVLHELRRVQYKQFRDPCITRTYGLQKKVADNLKKSPVAVHKSLKSCNYDLLAESANTMKAILT